MMPQNYTPESKKKIVRLHEEERRTYKRITADKETGMKRKVIGIFTLLCFAVIGISCGKGEMKGNQQDDWAVAAGSASSEKRGAKLNLEDGEFTDLRVEKMEKLSVYIEEMISAEMMEVEILDYWEDLYSGADAYYRVAVSFLEIIKDRLESGLRYSIGHYDLINTDGGTQLINDVTYMQKQGFCIEYYQFIKTDTYMFLQDKPLTGGNAVSFPVLVKFADKDGNAEQQLWIVTVEAFYDPDASMTYYSYVDFELY